MSPAPARRAQGKRAPPRPARLPSGRVVIRRLQGSGPPRPEPPRAPEEDDLTEDP